VGQSSSLLSPLTKTGDIDGSGNKNPRASENPLPLCPQITTFNKKQTQVA
jgi:hypothetical protein